MREHVLYDVRKGKLNYVSCSKTWGWLNQLVDEREMEVAVADG